MWTAFPTPARLPARRPSFPKAPASARARSPCPLRGKHEELRIHRVIIGQHEQRVPPVVIRNPVVRDVVRHGVAEIPATGFEQQFPCGVGNRTARIIVPRARQREPSLRPRAPSAPQAPKTSAQCVPVLRQGKAPPRPPWRRNRRAISWPSAWARRTLSGKARPSPAARRTVAFTP